MQRLSIDGNGEEFSANSVHLPGRCTLVCNRASLMGCKRNIMSLLSFNCLLFVDFVDLGGEGDSSH